MTVTATELSIPRTTADLDGLVVVLRGKFEANGITRQRGEVLRVEGWPYGRIDSLSRPGTSVWPPTTFSTPWSSVGAVDCGSTKTWLTNSMSALP